MKLTPIALIAGLVLASCAASQEVTRGLPDMAWDHREEAERWTRAGLTAVQGHGEALIDVVPEDIAEWCPGYASASDEDRAAFWVGLLSALAKHESTWRPDAVGGGGRWFGLTQISPGTARGYECRATSGEALLNGSANLSCAVRIAAAQVARDEAVVTDGTGWRGMARDWAPFRSASKRAAMKTFTSEQAYCQK